MEEQRLLRQVASSRKSAPSSFKKKKSSLGSNGEEGEETSSEESASDDEDSDSPERISDRIAVFQVRDAAQKLFYIPKAFSRTGEYGIKMECYLSERDPVSLRRPLLGMYLKQPECVSI